MSAALPLLGRFRPEADIGPATALLRRSGGIRLRRVHAWHSPAVSENYPSSRITVASTYNSTAPSRRRASTLEPCGALRGEGGLELRLVEREIVNAEHAAPASAGALVQEAAVPVPEHLDLVRQQC